MAALMARRSLHVNEKIYWETFALMCLGRWVGYTHLIEARNNNEKR